MTQPIKPGFFPLLAVRSRQIGQRFDLSPTARWASRPPRPGVLGTMGDAGRGTIENSLAESGTCVALKIAPVHGRLMSGQPPQGFFDSNAASVRIVISPGAGGNCVGRRGTYEVT